MTHASEIIACARGFLGVRFCHQGRGTDGLDCLGLLIATAEKAGMLFAGKPAAALDMPHYGARPDVLLLQRQLKQYLRAIPLAQIQPADVLLLKIDGSPQHLALVSDYPMVGELGMIHAYAPARKVVEHRYDAHWRSNSYAAYRLP